MSAIPSRPAQSARRAADTDGRTARAERTRTAIADAMLGLFEDGHLRPTATQVAERAGVSLRSVFQHFDDMEALSATVADLQLRRYVSRMQPVPLDGALSDRIAAFVAERARLHESIAPVRRAALLAEPFSDVIAERLAWVRSRARREVEKVFAPELEALPAAARRDTLEAVTVASSWSTWEALRAHQRLSVAKARSVVARMVETLLTDVTASQPKAAGR
jgi:AcrR family transcriptional regulator